ESYAVIEEMKTTLPLLGMDLIAAGVRLQSKNQGNAGPAMGSETFKAILERDSIWVGESLGKSAGDKLPLLINDRPASYTVRGTFPDDNGRQSAIVMDISAAQQILGKGSRVDRIYVRVPSVTAGPDKEDPASLEIWRTRAQKCLSEGASVRDAGA